MMRTDGTAPLDEAPLVIRSQEPEASAGRSRPAPLDKEVVAILREGKEIALSTLRPDGWPQTTVVNYVTDGARIFFGCSEQTQKVANIARDNRVSFSLLVPYLAWGKIYALSAAGRAERLVEAHEILRVIELLAIAYPTQREQLNTNVEDFVFYAVAPFAVTQLAPSSGLGHRHWRV